MIKSYIVQLGTHRSIVIEYNISSLESQILLVDNDLIAANINQYRIL